MKKIFLDIGAWQGDTIEIALDYDFDVIYAFEPSISNCKIIKEKIKDDRLILNEVGLYHKNKIMDLHHAGSIGASIFSGKKFDKYNKKKFPDTDQCTFIKASTWFNENISKEDYVIVKMNVEGAEISILNNLLITKEYDKINHMLISFDIGKVQGKGHLRLELQKQLKELEITNFIPMDEIKKVGKNEKSYPKMMRKILECYFEMIEVQKINK
ncbi:MAG: FkbM family methyltransferase [Promethearchaeota archaeon]